jgi:thiamine pyrophosphate-dependent acetolactate synthase large subunit-like protein
MLLRLEALRQITARLDGGSCLVSSLGYISRDLFSITADLRERCFYCMGSMGSVVPFALGISLAQPSLHVWAVEGDGSVLMNLGALVTVRRYSKSALSLFIFDNRCYESTGGQPSQPEGFQIEDVCRAIGLPTFVATAPEQLEQFLELRQAATEPAVLVVKVSLASPRARADEEPAVIAQRFGKWLRRAG